MDFTMSEVSFKTWIVRDAESVIDNALPFLILAYYHLTELENPEELVRAHHAFFHEKDVKGRIYLAKQGINGTLSAPKSDALAYINWLSSQSAFKNIEFKVQE